MLVRRWTPRAASTSDDWNTVTQIVVPRPFRDEILHLAHDDPFAGHLGVNKTYDRILRCFFWPGLKRDVKQYCKTCHVCQVCGKSNESVPSYLLYPIPVMGEPFERVIVDCVGPLPRTKAGNKFLLTIMCATTPFSEAVPLRGITTAAILKVLLKFFSVFGLPKVVQTDQGTNFMSRIFSQVMKQLGVSHHYASACHPESQGALEPFHATLKSMLHAYCFETGRDWDEGVHLLLFATREVIQESLGFSPADLVFAHTVRGPLSLVYAKWLSDQKQQNLCDYVSNFRFKLHRACRLAKQKLSATQAKMKTWFDKDAKTRTFKPGDKVLILLPILGSALQARFSGPYEIKEKIGDRDYIVATPDRRRRTRLCHVNMLKPYFDSCATSQFDCEAEGKAVLVLCSAELLETVVGESDHFNFPSPAVVQGRLQNSEVLASLDLYFTDLSGAQREDVFRLIKANVGLFSGLGWATHHR